MVASGLKTYFPPCGTSLLPWQIIPHLQPHTEVKNETHMTSRQTKNALDTYPQYTHYTHVSLQ